MHPWGMPLTSEVDTVVQNLTPEMLNAIRHLFGPENDTALRNVVVSQMQSGHIQRLDGKLWGSEEPVTEIKWAQEKPVTRLVELEVEDVDGHICTLTAPCLYYGGTDLWREGLKAYEGKGYLYKRLSTQQIGRRLKAYEGKGYLSIPWSRIKEVAVLGENEAAGPDWSGGGGNRGVRGELTLTSGKRAVVSLVGAHVNGSTDLGTYNIALAQCKRLVPKKLEESRGGASQGTPP